MHCKSILTVVCCEHECEHWRWLWEWSWSSFSITELRSVCWLWSFTDGLNVVIDNWTPAGDSEAFDKHGRCVSVVQSVSALWTRWATLKKITQKKFCSLPWPQQLNIPPPHIYPSNLPHDPHPLSSPLPPPPPPPFPISCSYYSPERESLPLP